MRKILLLIFLLCSACLPYPMAMKAEPPEGASPLYAKAWRDGCNSGMMPMGNSFYKFIYGANNTFNIDAELVNNDEYQYVWWRAFKYCRHGTRAWLKQ